MRTRVETGTAFELLGTVLAFVLPVPDDETPPVVGSAPPGAAAPPLVADDAAAILADLGQEPLINLFGFVAGAAETGSAESLVAGLGRLGDGELLRVLAGYHRRSIRRATDPAIVAAALDGDRRARAALLETSFPEVGHWHASLEALTGPRRVAIARGAVAALERLAGALRDRLAAGLERAAPAADHARELVTTLPIDVAIEQLAAEGAIVFARAIGQEDVVINPRGSDRRVFAVVDYGPTLVVSYPAPEPGAVSVPPGRLVALGQALGDERRLRILRALGQRPLTIAELVASIGMPRSSLQYHLAILREAGLVGWAVDDAETGPLALRRAALAEIETGLRAYLAVGVPDRDE